MICDDGLNPAKLKTNLSKNPIYTIDDLLKVLVVETRTKKELRAAVMGTTEMGDTTFHNLFKKLEAMEGVTFNPQTKKYSYANADGGAKLT